MKLKKPLVVFDLETTGTWIEKDRIIEIGMVKVLPDGSKEKYRQLVNPSMAIPDEVIEITGISNEDVKDAPYFKNIVKEVIQFIGDSDLGGFNCERFDLPLLLREIRDVGLDLKMEGRTIYDAQKVFHYHEKRDLTAAVKLYCDKDLEGAHSALVDTEATLDVIEAQVQKYGEGSEEIEILKEFEYKRTSEFYDAERKFRWWGGKLYMMFGKYAGKESLDIIAKKDPGYLDWILSKDFSPEVKSLVEDALNGRCPTK